MEKIKQGDKVFIEFIGPNDKVFDTVTGVLTKIWEDEPYCMIDGKNVDLAGEGHTTRVGLIPDKKILIIGQAPPAVKQELPYDTTQLYSWLKEQGISKFHAQHIFEFEAVYQEFPGYDAQKNHLKPTLEQMNAHFDSCLKNKIESADKIIILGNVAKDFFNSKKEYMDVSNKKIIFLIHPSQRNCGLYYKNFASIQTQLKEIIHGLD